MSSRLTRLAAVIAGAAVITAAVVVVSSAETSSKPATRTKTATAVLAGIPEHRGVLGDPQAPVTLTEFVDPQCPICAATSRDVLPTLIDDYVRTGKAKLDARVLSFLGPDSVTMARHAAGAREQNRLWAYLETVYANQGEENSGYVMPSFLARIAAAAGVRDSVPADADAAVKAASAEADRLGVTGTPTFVLTRRDGSRTIVDPTKLDDVL